MLPEEDNKTEVCNVIDLDINRSTKGTIIFFRFITEESKLCSLDMVYMISSFELQETDVSSV